MGKQCKKISNDTKLGTGSVTELQVAFMVECYLRDHKYIKTLKLFQEEASALLLSFKSVPKRLMSLNAILNDYITLKEQRLTVSQEKARMENLFRGLQDMIGAYEVGSLPAWFPAMEASLNGAAIACSAPVMSTPIYGTAPSNTAFTSEENNFSGTDRQQKSSVQATQPAKRKDPARSRNLRPGDIDVSAQWKKARPDNGGEHAELKAKSKTSHSSAQEDLQLPTNFSSQIPATVKATAHRSHDPQTPPRPGSCQVNGSIIQTNCSNNHSDMTEIPYVSIDQKYPYADNSPVYASNAVYLSGSCQPLPNARSDTQGIHKPQRCSYVGDVNSEHIVSKQLNTKCRTLNFETEMASTHSTPVATASSTDGPVDIRENLRCRLSPELRDPFLDDFLSTEAVTPEDLSSLDDILADLGDVSFSELLADVIPERIGQPTQIFQEDVHQQPVHEVRLIEGDVNRKLVNTNVVQALAELTDKDMNGQGFKKSDMLPVSPLKAERPHDEKVKESRGKENITVAVRRDKKTASGVHRL